MKELWPTSTLRCVTFTLPFVLDSLNTRLRQHWAKRSGDDKQLTLEIMAAIGGPRYYPRPPFKRARVSIVRIGIGQLDPDGLPAAQKPLIDALCVASSRHPGGLGIIEDDSARHIELVVNQRRANATPTTCVRIEELPEIPRPRSPKRYAPKRPSRKAIAFGIASQKP